MKKVSVIIPMYNSENYIGQCIRSVADQTYRNLEIIVVDDGSTDKGIHVCAELMETDARIRLCRQENRGVSAARNHGIDIATGEYVFFLDSDDAVHPLLLEELLGRAEEKHAQLAFCGYRKTDSCRMETVLAETSGLERTEAAGETREEKLSEDAVKTSPGVKLSEDAGKTSPGEELSEDARKAERGENSDNGAKARWLTADEAGTEEWLHVKYTDTFSGIGGKLILREAIGNLRFDRELTNGEDTFFLYQLVKRGVRSVYCLEEWYYYRVHGQSVTNSAGTARGMRYFESARRIRDGEYESGHADYAMRWEILVVDQIKRNYAAQKSGDAEKSGSEKKVKGVLKTVKAGSEEKINETQGTGKAKKAQGTGSPEEAGRDQRAKKIVEAEKGQRPGNALEARRTLGEHSPLREHSSLWELRRIAAAERQHPMFRRICFSDRVLFTCCFACDPVYVILNRIVLFLANRRSQ